VPVISVLLAARRAGGQVRFNADDIRKEVILLWTFSYRGGVSARAAMLGDHVFGGLDADHGGALPYNKSDYGVSLRFGHAAPAWIRELGRCSAVSRRLRRTYPHRPASKPAEGAQCPPFGQLNSSFFGGPEDFSEAGTSSDGTSRGQAPGAGPTPVVSTPSATTA
jgi:hypothetical protein